MEDRILFHHPCDAYLARSPVYSYLSASIQGVPIIRAYGAGATCVRDFARCLDEHTRVYSVMLGMNRWSAMRIECVVAAFVGLLAFSILLMHRSKTNHRHVVDRSIEIFRYTHLWLELATGILLYSGRFYTMDCSTLSRCDDAGKCGASCCISGLIGSL